MYSWFVLGCSVLWFGLLLLLFIYLVVVVCFVMGIVGLVIVLFTWFGA